jgi:hypothetical protein
MAYAFKFLVVQRENEVEAPKKKAAVSGGS